MSLHYATSTINAFFLPTINPTPDLGVHKVLWTVDSYLLEEIKPGPKAFGGPPVRWGFWETEGENTWMRDAEQRACHPHSLARATLVEEQ